MAHSAMPALDAHLVSLLQSATPPGAAGGGLDIVDLIWKASLVVKLVLLLLIGLSVASWYIIAFKWYFLRRAQGESLSFLETFWQTRKLEVIYQTSEKHPHSPISQM